MNILERTNPDFTSGQKPPSPQRGNFSPSLLKIILQNELHSETTMNFIRMFIVLEPETSSG